MTVNRREGKSTDILVFGTTHKKSCLSISLTRTWKNSCFNASSTVRRRLGSTTRSLEMRSLGASNTSEYGYN
jgi:hypothetical protein